MTLCCASWWHNPLPPRRLRGVPRSGAEARAGLQRAALELYVERGYEATTTAEIAERAGLNHRTFFRHFVDKREVLFDGQDGLLDELAQSVADAPAHLSSLEMLLRAFSASAHVLEGRADQAKPRMRLIASTPALFERDLAKGAAIADALAQALTARGEPRDTAQFVATLGWATFHHAAAKWTHDLDHPLSEYLTEAFADLARVAAPLVSRASVAVTP